MKKNKFVVFLIFWFIAKIALLLFLCFLQILFVIYIGEKSSPTIIIGSIIILVYFSQILLLIFSIIGVSKRKYWSEELLKRGAAYILATNVLLLFRIKNILLPLSGIGDFILIIWIINQRQFKEYIMSKKLDRSDWMGLEKYININEKNISFVILISIISILILETIIVLNIFSQY